MSQLNRVSDKIRFTIDKERINCKVLRPIWPLTSANWKRIPELLCALCFAMTLRGNREKKISLLFQRYRKWNKKKGSQIHPRGRHTKNVAKKIATTCLCRLWSCRWDIENAVRKTVPYKYVIDRDSGTICGKFTIYATILFVALTSEIFSVTALFATKIDWRVRRRKLSRVTI